MGRTRSVWVHLGSTYSNTQLMGTRTQYEFAKPTLRFVNPCVTNFRQLGIQSIHSCVPLSHPPLSSLLIHSSWSLYQHSSLLIQCNHVHLVSFSIPYILHVHTTILHIHSSTHAHSLIISLYFVMSI